MTSEAQVKRELEMIKRVLQPKEENTPYVSMWTPEARALVQLLKEYEETLERALKMRPEDQTERTTVAITDPKLSKYDTTIEKAVDRIIPRDQKTQALIAARNHEDAKDVVRAFIKKGQWDPHEFDLSEYSEE